MLTIFHLSLYTNVLKFVFCLLLNYLVSVIKMTKKNKYRKFEVATKQL